MRWGRLILLAGNLILLNLLLLRGGWQWDATEEGVHTLSPEIPGLLQKLPTTAKVFFVASESKQATTLKPLVRQIQDILRHVKEASAGKLEIEFIDPYQNPQKRSYVESHFGVTRFPAETADGGRAEVFFSVVVEVGTQSEVLLNDKLVRPTVEGGNELSNFEGLLIRTLNKLSRRYQTLHQTLIQAGATGKLRMMPVISDNIDSRFVGVKALIEGVVGDLIDTYPDIRQQEADLNDEKFLKKLEVANMRPIQLPGQEPFWCHLLLARPDGSSIEVPNLLFIRTAQEMRQWIEQYLLLLLDQGGRQLGVVIPNDVPGAQNPYSYLLLPYFQRDFQVNRLQLPLVTVPPGIETLLVMGLSRADEDTVREIDKFLMRGGSLILFADSYDLGFQDNEAKLFPIESGFENLIKNWGVELEDPVGVGPGVEMAWQRKSTVGRHASVDLEVARSPYTPLVKADEEAPRALPLAGVDGVVMSYPNLIALKETRNLRVTPLLKGGLNSWAAVTPDAVNPFDPEGNFTEPEKKKWDLEDPLYGVLLEGSFSHYETPGVTEDFVRTQSLPARVALIADADFVDMNFWYPRWRGVPTQELQSRVSDNMLFLRNLVDWAFGDDEILKVGSRVARIRDLDPEAKEDKQKKQQGLWAFGPPFGFLLVVGLWRWRRRRRG